MTPKAPVPVLYASLGVMAATWVFILYNTSNVTQQLIDRGYNSDLPKGWFAGRQIDLSDQQWRDFRKNIPLLTGGALAFIALSQLVRRFSTDGTVIYTFSPNDESVYGRRRVFYLAVSLGFMGYLFGINALFPLIVCVINYTLATGLGDSPFSPAAAWILNLAVLISCDWYKGYTFTMFGLPSLDLYFKGIMRWHVYYRMIFLRNISFSMDYYWALTQKQLPAKLETRDDLTIRTETHLPLKDYSLINYLMYSFYVPLLLAGPISSFNAWLSQFKNPQQTHSTHAIVKSVAWLVTLLVFFEISLHFIYWNHLLIRHRYYGFPSYILWMCGYLVLNFMWFKFLIIWRFFRLWALGDGIDTTDNMERCVNNNMTFTGFWRGWHCSFNKFNVRYIYLPLGGRSTQTWNIWVIFIFIGMWHDLNVGFCAWALFNCVCFTSEIGVLRYFGSDKFAEARAQLWWRWLKAVAGGLGVIALIFTNLAIMLGFSYSFEFVYLTYLRPEGWLTLAGSWFYYSSATLWMMWLREREQEVGAVGGGIVKRS